LDPQQFSWTPYLIPLAFNTLWFWAVFVQRQYSLAVWILGLNLVVATWSAYRVYRYSPSAARWLLPSLLWLVFAVVWWVEE
jgi:tryptophan-rich sensory protein